MTKTENHASIHDKFLLGALILTTLVTRFAFVYHDRMGDPDSVAMAAGIALGLSPHIDIGDAVLYGRQVNPGIYLFFKAVYPLIFDSPAHVMAFMNGLGVLCATLLVAPFYVILRRYFDTVVAAGCTFVFVFSPLVWEVGTYFHPITPAMLFFLLAVLAYERIRGTLSGVLYFGLTVVLAATATLTRSEVLLAVPALVVASWLSPFRKRHLALIGVLLAVVGLSYIAMIHALSAETTAAYGGLGGFVRDFFDRYLSRFAVNAALRQLVWTTLGIGVGTVVVTGIGFLAYIAARRPKGAVRLTRRDIAVAVTWITVPLVFWIQLNFPVLRHFLLVVFGFVWLFGAVALFRRSTKAVIAIVVLVVLCNLLIPEILYKVYNSRHPAAPKTPHGTFFSFHESTYDRTDRFEDLQTSVLDFLGERSAARSDETPQANAPGEIARPAVLVQVEWESYAYLVYGLAKTGRLRKQSVAKISPGTHVHPYVLDGEEIRLVFFKRKNDPDAWRDFHSYVKKAKADGCRIFIPEETVTEGAPGNFRDLEYVLY